jgi:hypothetical protein
MSINVAANPTAAIFAVGTLIGEAPRRIEWPTPSVQACLVELQPLFVCYDLHLLNYERNIEIMTVLLISKIKDRLKVERRRTSLSGDVGRRSFATYLRIWLALPFARDSYSSVKPS